jgi:hypothetical protein
MGIDSERFDGLAHLVLPGRHNSALGHGPSPECKGSVHRIFQCGWLVFNGPQHLGWTDNGNLFTSRYVLTVSRV